MAGEAKESVVKSDTMVRYCEQINEMGQWNSYTQFTCPLREAMIALADRLKRFDDHSFVIYPIANGKPKFKSPLIVVEP